MSTESLRAELLAVPGVAAAEVGEAGGSPSGVKVQLAAGADAGRVGVAVQRILAAHGMRARFADESDREPPAAPGSPATPSPAPVVADAPEPPAPEPGPPPSLVELEPAPSAAHEAVPAPTMTVVPSPPLALPPCAPPRLQSVALEERADGLTTVVSLANGHTGTRDTALDMGDLDESIAAALADAAGRMVEFVAVEWSRHEGESVVTVVLREDGSLRAGAAVMRAGRAFAVAAATRVALDV